MALFSTFAVPSIFWTTLIASAALLATATLVGRLLAACFPLRIRATAAFYLAPALGLATLTLLASLAGRVLALGDTLLVPVSVAGLAAWGCWRERASGAALRHAAAVAAFGVCCGASILAPLLVYGGMSPHNDAFSYLVHANWLQDHAFGALIDADSVTPLSTQVAMYQREGFRMGASFLLALAQSLLNLRWSFEVYPAVMIAALAACCLTVGFPLARSLRPLRRPARLALLALPAFSLGGLVFGANMGFLPQTVGLAFAAGLLFAVGPSLRWLAATAVPRGEILRAAVPAGVLLAAAVYAYSELAPFLAVAVAGAGLPLLLRRHGRQRQNLVLYAVLVVALAGLLLNTELLRAYAALRTQSGAVVGAPVDWSLAGYAAHAFGVHGGAWDGFQWASAARSTAAMLGPGMVLLGLVAALLLAGAGASARLIRGGELLPAVLLVLVFCVALIYFRYGVASPFASGVGQSWSQFKLADWAHPFLMPFVLLGAIALRRRAGPRFAFGVATLFALGMAATALIGVLRLMPLVQYYGATRDLNAFYQEFRETVNAVCPPAAPVYLALKEPHIKFRLMAVYYLPDRLVRADWEGDEYVAASLPAARRTAVPAAGDCVVEAAENSLALARRQAIGRFSVGVFEGAAHASVRASIVGVSGAHGRETDGANWWHWVERKVSFALRAPADPAAPAAPATSRLRFEYGLRQPQTLTVTATGSDGELWQFSRRVDATQLGVFEATIDLPPGRLRELAIETDAAAGPTAANDPRRSAFMVRNLSIDGS